jgi:hypothetical protein
MAEILNQEIKDSPDDMPAQKPEPKRLIVFCDGQRAPKPETQSSKRD